ncbi:MAG: hypothetical protein SVU88_01665 [Candidatus Nanohaloarchaea archaeon]|nr:hypothetical protein [Candidatus Nanohaloarchaea archaeon]
MDADVREEGGKTIISPSERNHTLMTLLKRAVWEADGRAGYNRGHPYEGDTGELVVEADDVAGTVADAIDHARSELDEFRDAFESA